MLAERKRFRIEGPARPGRLAAIGPRTTDAPSDRIMTASVAAMPAAGTMSDPPLRHQAEPPRDVGAIAAELAAMRAAIAAMRRDVASMQRCEAGHSGIQRAACELDAVFDATERATTTILGAVEDIEGAATLLRGSGLDAGRDGYVGTILERVVLLYETCNFQDVTGQRIEKVVKTLKFVEERLDAIAGRMTADPAAADAQPVPEHREPAIHGPALAIDEPNSQSDIDSYFG